MGRKPKHPDHKEQAEKLMNDLLNSLVSLWTSEEDPQLNTVSEELEMSAAKEGLVFNGLLRWLEHRPY